MSGHPEVERLAAYADGDLDAPAAAEVETHLADCASCRANVAAVRRVAADLAALPPLAMPVDVAAAVDAALAAERERPAPGGDVVLLPKRRSRLAAWVGGAVAASLLGVLALGAVDRLGDGAGRGEDSGAMGAADDAARGTHRFASGYAYSPDNLTVAAKALVAGRPPAAVAAPNAGAVPRHEAASPPAYFSGETLPPGDVGVLRDDLAVDEELRRLIDDPRLLTACLDQLRESPGSPEPLAIDAGTFAGRPALVVVLPFRNDEVDVFVVGSGCGRPPAAGGPPDADLLHFARVAAS